ncbi:putative oxygenase MesX [Microbacterium tenebrionis]|uniref:putative oxygenase MesX n=1 Tax=Microbacterium tenebrionis TaxID=2830665 RepID=UPI00158A2475|nr:putative oxygenase MesX [Microbacterium ihumii]
MSSPFEFRIRTARFDESYAPSATSRTTTNFANLARGENRRQNLRSTLAMIDDRFNALARDDNPTADRYSVELEIVSADLYFDADGVVVEFPLIEILDVTILDTRTRERIDGIVGNNFSSYVRDYDFSVLLPRHTADAAQSGLPEGFGDLHGGLFQRFLDSDAYRERFCQPPVICISVSSSKTYRRLGTDHPVLGVEYQQSEFSLTDEYFARMGMQVRFFMPPGAAAPLAFYFRGDLLADYSDLALIGTISTMETFQKIYRPEIYNATAQAQEVYRPRLDNPEYTETAITYDRAERSRLGITQGKYTEEHLITPFRSVLERWAGEPIAAGSHA